MNATSGQLPGVESARDMKTRSHDGERILAVFIDFENVGLGFGNRRDRFSIDRVLERLVEKGKIVAKKAYADWSRFGNYASSLHAAAVELVEIPKRAQTGKNSADIRMCVDAMDLAYSKDHIDTFVIVSGDSDFSPLVSKLKELGKHVIGLGLAESTSELLRDNCDEFIYYEDLDRVDVAPMVENAAIPEIKRKAFSLLLDSLLALRRENKEVIYSSMVKDTMKRKKPSFNEEYHGYRTFSELLEDAQRWGILDLERHKTSGTYMVTRFGGEPKVPPPGVVVGVVTRPTLKVAEPGPRALPEALLRREPSPPLASEPREAWEAPELRPERGRRRPEPTILTRPPIAVTPPAPAPSFRGPQPQESEELTPLGRALIEEVLGDEDGLDDDIPSYMPRKSSPTAPPSKPVPRTETVAPASPPAEKKARSEPASGTAVTPRRGSRSSKAPAEKPATNPARPRGRNGKSTSPTSPSGTAVPDRPEIPPTPVRPPAVPPAKTTDEDEFGAGLEL